MTMRLPVCLTMVIASALCATTPSPDDDRACWQDEDCFTYPPCHTRPLSCRCQLNGICLLARGLGEHCLQDIHCAVGMTCSMEGVCDCEEGTKHLKWKGLCVPVPNLEPPRFADLPDEEDPDGPQEIPPTYEGPLLVGVISIGLVVLCLGTALWCRCTSPRTPGEQSSPSYHEPRERNVEKIPLDLLYVPPPAGYQTPGYHHNYASTSTSSTTRLVQH